MSGSGKWGPLANPGRPQAATATPEPAPRIQHRHTRLLISAWADTPGGRAGIAASAPVRRAHPYTQSFRPNDGREEGAMRSPLSAPPSAQNPKWHRLHCRVEAAGAKSKSACLHCGRGCKHFRFKSSSASRCQRRRCVDAPAPRAGAPASPHQALRRVSAPSARGEPLCTA